MAKNNGEEKNEVAVFIGQAIEKGLPVETMEKLFALREKVKAEQAREAYVDALSTFQSQCPVIKKTKKVMNKDGQSVRDMYAPLDTIAEQIKKPLALNGLSYSWEVENKEGLIRATAKVTHRLGHSETSSFEVPIDKEGFMTAPQKYASALTFAKRYSLCDILGIATSDEDTDAVDVGKEKAAKSAKSRIVFLLRTLGDDTKTKEAIASAVMNRTGLDLEEANLNYPPIAVRLFSTHRLNPMPVIFISMRASYGNPRLLTPYNPPNPVNHNHGDHCPESVKQNKFIPWCVETDHESKSAKQPNC